MNGAAKEIDVINNPDVRKEALKFLFSELPSISTILFAFPLVVVFFFWNHADRFLLTTWMISLYIVYLLRIFLAKRFIRQIEYAELDIDRWGLYFTLTSLASGTLWGIAGALLYLPEQATLVTLLYVIIVGTAAGQIIVAANWLPSVYAYSCTALGILSLNLMLVGDAAERALATLVLLYLVMIIRVTHKARRVIYEGIALRYENLDLIHQLKNEKNAAEQANLAKTRFLASANHDLRQPVQAIKLFASALKPELVSSRGKEVFDDLSASIQSLSELLESLLNLSKLDAGIIRPVFTDFSLNSIFNQLLREFLPIATAKQLRISVRSTSVTLTSDPTLLGNLLRNLLVNAFRHVQQGGVLMGARIRDDRCVIEVWDTGSGIPDEEKQRIFEPFYQIHNKERDRSQGLGLGLAICKQLALILDAQLDFHSRTGSGTVFRLTMRRSNVSTEDLAQISPPVRQPSSSTIKGRHVLIVDDNRQVASAMQAALESLDITCDSADGPEQAMQIMQNQRMPDHILCDHRLREGLTSLDLIQQMQQLKHIPPVIIITGDTSRERLLEASSSGYPVLHKPIDIDELQYWMLKQKPI